MPAPAISSISKRKDFSESTLLAVPGLGNHQPSRRLNRVSKTDIAGVVRKPMFDDTAAPEIPIANPAETSGPNCSVGTKPVASLPQCCGVMKNESDFRSCVANWDSVLADPMLTAQLMIWSGT